MKKFILIAAVLMASISFGSENPSLKNEIINKVNANLSGIELDDAHQDFVVVSFYIKDFQVHILDIQGSQKELIQMISNELSEMCIEKEYSDSDVYNYKFTFKKA
ncbi:MAG: hypothetical protein GQ574_14015 [Crocinitomix sp.]|nr:hypothetical protein [Crocinitomix sp.]